MNIVFPSAPKELIKRQVNVLGRKKNLIKTFLPFASATETTLLVPLQKDAPKKFGTPSS